MVHTVRCFKCGEHAARIVMANSRVMHARCHACGSNLLAEVLELEASASGATLQDADDAPSVPMKPSAPPKVV